MNVRQVPEFLFVVVTLGGLAIGQGPDRAPADAPATPKQTDATVVRVYDIRVLTTPIPDYTGSPTLARAVAREDVGGKKLFGDDDDDRGWIDPSRSELVDQVLDAIRMVVDRDSWLEAGGSVGSLREVNGRLVVEQTPAAQKKIADLLKQLEGTDRQTQANVTGWFFMAPAAAVERLNRERAAGTMVLSADAYRSAVDGVLGGEGGIRLVATARQTMHLGQRTWCGNLTESPLSPVPHPSGDGAGRQGPTTRPVIDRPASGPSDHAVQDGRSEEPSSATRRCGVILSVSPVARSAGQVVQCTLEAQLAMEEPVNRPDSKTGAPAPRAPSVSRYNWQTTVAIPDGGAVMLTTGFDAGGAGKPAERLEGVLLLHAKLVP